LVLADTNDRIGIRSLRAQYYFQIKKTIFDLVNGKPFSEATSNLENEFTQGQNAVRHNVERLGAIVSGTEEEKIDQHASFLEYYDEMIIPAVQYAIDKGLFTNSDWDNVLKNLHRYTILYFDFHRLAKVPADDRDLQKYNQAHPGYEIKVNPRLLKFFVNINRFNSDHLNSERIEITLRSRSGESVKKLWGTSDGEIKRGKSAVERYISAINRGEYDLHPVSQTNYQNRGVDIDPATNEYLLVTAPSTNWLIGHLPGNYAGIDVVFRY
jgi:hypothetical protein